MDRQPILKPQWTRIDGGTIFARAHTGHRAGPALVLVHGVAVSSSYMAPLAQALASRGHAVFAPDLPGYGRSFRPPGALDVPQLAASLADWLNITIANPAVLVANSFGCQVVVDLAARHPELVHSLILIGPTLDSSIRSFFHPLWRQVRSLANDHPSIVPLVMHDILDMGFARALRIYYHCLHDRIEDRLPHVNAPVLVLRGEGDNVADHSWCDRVVRLLPNASLQVISHGGHVVHYTKPTETAALINRFLTTLAWSAC